MEQSPTTIDQVVDRLSTTVGQFRVTRSWCGYFAAPFRKVTVEVQRGIKRGFFDDGLRMKQLDVIFARRYVDAHDGYRRGRSIPRSWRFAFDAGRPGWPIVLQDPLAGYERPHQFRPGVAAARTAGCPTAAALRESRLQDTREPPTQTAESCFTSRSTIQ